MSEQMTVRERITNALEGQRVDRLPFCPFLAYVWEYFPQEIQQAGMLAFHQMIGADPLWRGAPCPVTASTPGITTREFTEGRLRVTETETPVGTIRYGGLPSDEGKTCFIWEHPLKSEEDCKVQIWIEEHTEYTFDPTNIQAHLAGEGQQGLSIGMLTPHSKSAFQILIEHFIGTEELNYALVDYPDTVEALLEVMVAKDLEAVRLAAQCEELTYFLTWEDSSTQNYSPTQYDRYIGSEISQWCDILAANGKKYIQHACGHLKTILPNMKEQGICAVESLSPIPTGNITLADARAILGADCGIIGGIEPVEFLTKSLAELEPYVEQVIEDGRGGPFVLANSDSCPPGVTIEKFKLVADIARRVRV